MNESLLRPCTAFAGDRRLAAGPLVEVALAVKNAGDGDPTRSILVFDDETGRAIDIDTRGTRAEVIARLSLMADASRSQRRSEPTTAYEGRTDASPRGRGRPRLGVVAREVTLLPRHWEWLGAQPGGASAALRRLVDEARRAGGAKDRIRSAHEAAYRFMSAMAGNYPAFEEATRALFANDRQRFEGLVAGWPADVRDHAIALAFGPLAEPLRGQDG